MILDFFNLRPDAFGLDISDLSIKLARLKRSRKGLALSSFGEVALVPGVVTGGEVKKSDQLVLAIKKAMKDVKGKPLDTKWAVVSLPEEKAFLQVVQLPQMKQEQIENAVRFEAENYIPYSLDTVYLDSQVITPLVRNHLDHMDVLLASLPRPAVDAYLSVIQKAGIMPLAFEIESLSIARSVIPNEVTAAPQLIIDLGAMRTSFIIFAGSSLRFTASIPISSVQLTEHIAKSLKIDFKQAEYTKLHYGLAGVNDPEGKEVFDALIPPLTDLLEQIKKHMSFYESHSDHQHLPVRQRAIKKVLLCGGGANLPGLPEFLRKELDLDVKLGNPWSNILPSPLREVPGMPFKDSMHYTTALGLALRGVRIDYD
ncbi:MAG TPA: type IV pilus assembly protein PilM [Candidatus Wildermuthbacteria bacterium]|nr:type IV pilus assembly protein PilM [Candidatus Wildermuthbacteria bacterium]